MRVDKLLATVLSVCCAVGGPLSGEAAIGSSEACDVTQSPENSELWAVLGNAGSTGLTADSERNASDAPAGTCPAYKISWGDVRGADLGTNWPYHAGVDASSCMGKLAAKTDLSGIVPSDRIFDLPTRAQWEYVCRAGTDTAWNNGFGINCYTNINADAVDDNESTSNPTTLYSYVGFRLALVYELGSKD